MVFALSVFICVGIASNNSFSPPHFEVPVLTIKRWWKKFKETGSVTDRPRQGAPKALKRTWTKISPQTLKELSDQHICTCLTLSSFVENTLAAEMKLKLMTSLNNVFY